MTDNNLYSPYKEPERPKWQIGKLSNGSFSHEDFLDLARSFLETEPFLDAIGYILKRADFVFGLREMNADAYRSFLDPPPHEAAVAVITNALSSVYLAWKIASDSNPAVASFNGDLLENLRNEIHQVNRDAIDAACNGTESQKFRAAYRSREDLTNAFYRLHRELGIHRAKYDLKVRVSGDGDPKHTDMNSGTSEEDNSLNGLTAEVKLTVTRFATEAVKDKKNQRSKLAFDEFRLSISPILEGKRQGNASEIDSLSPYEFMQLADEYAAKDIVNIIARMARVTAENAKGKKVLKFGSVSTLKRDMDDWRKNQTVGLKTKPSV